MNHILPPAFFQWCLRTSLAQAISQSMWGFAVLETIHLIGLVLVLGSIFVINLRILGFGVKTVRTAGNVAMALDMIAERVPEFALLDVGLVREQSFEIAEKLTELNIPFAFATGYGPDRVPPEFADRPRLPKPCPREALLNVLRTRPGGGE